MIFHKASEIFSQIICRDEGTMQY